MYKLSLTNSFKKDLKKAKKQNRDINKLNEVIDVLVTGKKLDEKYKDHSLSGNYKGYRECHIENDWLLVYTIKEDIMILILSKLGSHSNIFK